MLPGSMSRMMFQKNNMKKNLLLSATCIVLLSSCGLFGRSQKSGCPVGRNIGAERILANDPVALKAAKKANKNNKQAKVFYN